MLNNVTFMGRFTANPELKTTQSGVSYTSFTLACDRDIPDKQTNERQADFVEFTAWRQTAEFICRNFTKGRMVVIHGRLESSNYTDKDGNNRKTVRIRVENAYFAGDKPQQNDGAVSAPRSAQAPQQQAPNGGYAAHGYQGQPQMAAPQQQAPNGGYAASGYQGQPQMAAPQQQAPTQSYPGYSQAPAAQSAPQYAPQPNYGYDGGKLPF